GSLTQASTWYTPSSANSPLTSVAGPFHSPVRPVTARAPAPVRASSVISSSTGPRGPQGSAAVSTSFSSTTASSATAADAPMTAAPAAPLAASAAAVSPATVLVILSLIVAPLRCATGAPASMLAAPGGARRAPSSGTLRGRRFKVNG